MLSYTDTAHIVYAEVTYCGPVWYLIGNTSLPPQDNVLIPDIPSKDKRMQRSVLKIHTVIPRKYMPFKLPANNRVI